MGNMTPLDPVKLAKKYMWLLIIAAVAGGVLGTAAHFILLKVHPTYVSEVIFEIKPPDMDPSVLWSGEGRADEFERFMATQQARMVSEQVLEKVAANPMLPTEAPNWSKPFIKGGQVNTIEATEELGKVISARILTGTSYIKLTAKWTNPVDVTALAKLTRDAYQRDITSSTNIIANQQRDAINTTIQKIGQDIADLNTRRERMLRDQTVDSLDDKSSALGQQQTLVLNQLSVVNQSLTVLNDSLRQMEAMRNAETGITYSDTQRAAANQDPIVMGLRQQLKSMEVELQQLRQQGILPSHREYKRLQARIDSINQQVSASLEEALARNFDAEYDGLKREIQNYQAQNAKLTQEAEGLRTQLADLMKTITDIEDIQRQVNELIAARQEAQISLNSLNEQAGRETAGRVAIFSSERKPNQPSFPKIYIMIPAGVVMLAGLVGGVVVLRELLDQRVKGPSDVTLLPRAKVLGMVPSAEEDPSVGEKVGTVFRDAPSSVLAEHFRQVRTAVVKHMQRHGHKSLVVVGGMPGSGSTTVVANVALACASTDLRVLAMDGNFRRPALHRLFKVSEGPGLADALAGLVQVDQVIQHVPGEAKLDLVAVGSSEHRMYERLGAHQMTELLNAVKDRYDLILIDVAPALVSGDGMAVANRADASMLVVRALGETRGMVARLRNELDDCRADLLGVLVNAVRSSAGGYMRQNIRVSRAYHTPGMKVGQSVDHQPGKD
ncbi:MAG: hypothetical protein DYG94_12345 [Leptolyngbya sp. PLA3]|nr:MAG: hypothetical protein EDM82_12800 [Cyanobacteria bacterium CYA]MCE7969515.1 hypothetical protein [Leptolyngbya sp. PL-A3]